MKLLSKPTRIAYALGLGLFMVSAAFPAGNAHADALFNAPQLERSMLDLYCTFPGQASGSCPQATPAAPALAGTDPTAAPGVSASDKAMWALEIFDQVTMLDTAGFNDFMTHAAADYRQHSEHRQAIELVLNSISVEHSADVTGTADHTADAVREGLRLELRNIRERNPVLTVVDDALIAFSIAYAFEFGKGIVNGGRSLWASRGLGLAKLDRFAIAVGFVTREVKGVKKLELMAIGIGTAAGIAHAIYQSFETVKLDPHHVLEPIQRDIVRAAGIKAAGERDELRAMVRETDAQLNTHAQAYRDRMTAMDHDVTQIQSDMEHLYNVAAQFRPLMDPIAQDLTEIRLKITELGRKLGGMELQGSPLN